MLHITSAWWGESIVYWCPPPPPPPPPPPAPPRGPSNAESVSMSWRHHGHPVPLNEASVMSCFHWQSQYWFCIDFISDTQSTNHSFKWNISISQGCIFWPLLKWWIIPLLYKMTARLYINSLLHMYIWGRCCLLSSTCLNIYNNVSHNVFILFCSDYLTS